MFRFSLCSHIETKQRVFHVLEVCKIIGAHKQALANHACVRSSIKAMSASVHEAEVLLNAAPTAIDPDDQLARRTCIPDDDPRVEAIGEEHRASLLYNCAAPFDTTASQKMLEPAFFVHRHRALESIGENPRGLLPVVPAEGWAAYRNDP